MNISLTSQLVTLFIAALTLLFPPHLKSDSENKRKDPYAFIDDLPTSHQWHRVGVGKHHGIALPLGALRGKDDAGIGEYLDLVPMIDWCHSIGFDCIQLLPLNDTGHTPSPYSPKSSMALHPIYLSLSALPSLEHYPSLTNALKKMQKRNNEQRISYQQVLEDKEIFLEKYFSLAGPSITASTAFADFVAANPWLETHGLYHVLKITHNNRPWWEWSNHLQNPDRATIESLKEKHKNELDLYTFIQFLCFDQWRQVKEAAEKRDVSLFGDMSIMVGRDSSDVWLHRDFFVLDYNAGAPPDMYNEEGQSWGLPLYNWKALEKADYSWWKERLKTLDSLYHILRVDNIHSFFQFWAVPLGKPGKEGSFLPESEHEALSEGKNHVHMLISSSNVLPIAEGMGYVPDSFKETLEKRGISSIKVLQWAHEGPDHSFLEPSKYDPLSLACVSTHDTESLTQWWISHHHDAEMLAHSRGWHCPMHLTPELHK
ncbi:MAG: 4-alpha-glucanotransferase, partial [Verrucomicrobia bacterium]|nr:4-alpha-glucanotransferase [Verrucomicrobiota bacterium]